MTTPRPRYSAQDVAKAFVTKYYEILNKSPEIAHKFYQESSLLGWHRLNGDVKTVTTLDGINGKIMSSDYKNCFFKTETVEFQKSLEGGILIAVTGLLTLQDGVEKGFSQTFFLAKQEDGFYVLNDILQVVDVSGLLTNTSIQDNQKKDQVAPTQNSVLCSKSDSPASSQTKEAVENGNVKKVSNSSVSKDTDAKVADANSYAVMASCEKVCPVLSPASDVKEEASPKMTYASMVAKKSPPTSPRVAIVHSNFDQETVAPPTSKAPPSLVNGAPKVSTPSSTESKSSATSNVVEPKIQPAKRIYIGGLPYDVTKQRVVEVLKQFGPVRRNSDSIQIRRHEDGFCCGFVEFESVDSARRAIEAHRVKFGKKESYIAYRRSSSDRGNNEKGSSPSRNNGRNANTKGRVKAANTIGRTRNSTGSEDEVLEGVTDPIVGRVRRGRLVEIAGIDMH